MEVLPVVVGGTGYNPNSIVGTSVVSTFIITAQPGSDKDLIIRIALSFRGKIKNISVKGVLTIGYNYLNLPSVVSKSSDLQLGIRLRRHRQKTVAGSKQGQRLQERTDYCGEFFYENDTLKFINHEKGRVVMTGTTPEYQYHLKDHLGNVRLTFTTKDEVDSTTATLEPANAAEEQNKYLRMEMARKVHSALFDHTNGGLMGYSQRLNGTANEKFGIARSLSVMPGDTVSAEVFVKYVDPAASNTQALTDFLSAIDNGTAPSGTVLDGINYPLSTSSFLYAGLLSSSPSENAPKAYLNWLVFDRDYNFKDGGYAPITTAAKENGDGVDHERLFTDNLVIKEPGYVYLLP